MSMLCQYMSKLRHRGIPDINTIALAKFFNAIPIKRKHSCAFSLCGSTASDRKSIDISEKECRDVALLRLYKGYG